MHRAIHVVWVREYLLSNKILRNCEIRWVWCVKWTLSGKEWSREVFKPTLMSTSQRQWRLLIFSLFFRQSIETRDRSIQWIKQASTDLENWPLCFYESIDESFKQTIINKTGLVCAFAFFVESFCVINHFSKKLSIYESTKANCEFFWISQKREFFYTFVNFNLMNIFW